MGTHFFFSSTPINTPEGAGKGRRGDNGTQEIIDHNRKLRDGRIDRINRNTEQAVGVAMHELTSRKGISQGEAEHIAGQINDHYRNRP